MDWTPETVGALAAALTTIIAALSSKQIVAAAIAINQSWQKGRAERLARQSLEDELNEKGHKYIIRRQDKRITQLEEQITVLYDERNKCREEYAALESRYETMDLRLNYLEAERKKRGHDSSVIDDLRDKRSS